MKKSIFNVHFDYKGIEIYYNSFTDKFVGIPKKLMSIFESDDWFEILSSKYPKHLPILEAAGLLVPNSHDELAKIRLANKQAAFGDRDFYMMVFPTQDCNLKCWYCYESHVKGSEMSEAIADRIVKMVEKKVKDNSIDSIRLAFFGGEPMIGFDRIVYPLSMRIKKILETAGKQFQTFFVTNASLITPETVLKLKEINPLFQITLDGNREKHNLVRIWKKDNSGTYDTIITAIKEITSKIYNPISYKMPIATIRINYDNSTLEHIDEMINDLKDIDRNSVSIYLERVWQTKKHVDSRQRQLLLTAVNKIRDNGFHVGFGSFGTKNVSCPAETDHFLIVNYDANLYRCNGRTLTPETAEGYLNEDGSVSWNEEIRAKRLGLATFENPRCLNCPMLPRCIGPCSQKLMEHEGFNDNICTINALDVSLEEYLKSEFEMRNHMIGNKIVNVNSQTE